MAKKAPVFLLIGVVLIMFFLLTACGGVSDSAQEIDLDKTDKEILDDLVFATYGDIFEINEQHNGLINLTNTEDTREGYVALSHDGTRIAFIDFRRDIIFVMDRDGSNKQKLDVPEGNHADIAWSPNDKQLVFVTNIFGSDGVSKINYLSIYDFVEGPTRIHSADVALNDPFYSSDGKKILFSQNRDLYTILTSGKELTQLTSIDNEDWYMKPIFSPNGKKILFINSKIADPGGDIKVRSTVRYLYVMDKDGSNIKQLTYSPDFILNPSWYPKGDRILYSVGAPNGNINEFRSIDVDTREIKQVFDVSTHSQEWEPTPTPTEQAFVEKTITSPFNATLRQVYASAQGQIEVPKEEGKITVECADVSLQDFMMEVVFLNPPGISFKNWSDGLIFRSIGRDDQFILALYENKWKLYNNTGEYTILDSGELSMNLKEGGKNRVQLFALGGKGYLYVNEVFIYQLDLSVRIGSGNVCITSQLFDEDINVITEFQDFSVWEVYPN